MQTLHERDLHSARKFSRGHHVHELDLVELRAIADATFAVSDRLLINGDVELLRVLIFDRLTLIINEHPLQHLKVMVGCAIKEEEEIRVMEALALAIWMARGYDAAEHHL